MKDLRERSKECRDGIPGAFQPLRAQIEQEKALFYSKNAEAIKKIIRERVEAGVKKKLPIVVRIGFVWLTIAILSDPLQLKDTLGSYQKYLDTNGVLTDEINEVMATT